MVILFVLGTIIGSFLNVVALRWNSGLSLGGRSSCSHCGKMLHWHELVPIFSYLYLGGRCAQCKAKISWQYPLVELWTGLLFATLPFSYIPVFCLYVVITIYDVRHKIIPNPLVYGAILISLLTAYAVLPVSPHMIDWLSGPILALFFVVLWLLSRGRAVGFGDAKLALSVGVLLSAAEGFSALIISFWIGAVVGLALIAKNRFSPLLREAERITMKSEIPFAPFLIFGAWIAVVFHLDLLHVSTFFQ